MIRVKEEQLEETQKPVVSSPVQSTISDTTTPESQQDKGSLNLFLQKPGSLFKLSKLLEVAKMTPDIHFHNGLNSHSTKVHTNASYFSYPCSQRRISHSPPSATYQQDTCVSSLLSATQLKGSPWITCSPQYIPHDDQLSKIQTEKSSQWFSLLPRSPCDESSVTCPSASSSSPQTIGTKSCSSPSPDSLATASYNAPAGISNTQSSVLQVVKPQLFQITLSCFCFVFLNTDMYCSC